MQLRIGRVQQNDSPLRKQAGEETGEGAAIVLTGAVTGAQVICDFGVAQKFGGGVHQDFNLRSENYVSYGGVGLGWGSRD